MIPTILFFSFLFLLGLFFSFKCFEDHKELDWYSRIRHKGDVVTLFCATYVRHRGEHIVEYLSLQNIAHIIMQRAALLVARIARKVERTAHEITFKLSRRNGESRETNSRFLREVSTHKQGLDTERVRRETSLTSEEEKE